MSELLQLVYLKGAIFFIIVLLTIMANYVKLIGRKSDLMLLRLLIIALSGFVLLLLFVSKNVYIIAETFLLVTATRTAFWVKAEDKKKLKQTGIVCWGIVIIAFVLTTCYWFGKNW